jgi:energy-coupling factor transporter ATP-binding protein EcfA2
MDLELDDLLAAGDKQYRDSLTDKDRTFEEPDYENKIPVAVDVDNGGLVHIELDEETRMGAFGASGSGKTTLAKAIMSRAYQGGWKILHGSDIKNDFRTFNRKGGASKKLQKETEGLLKGEEAQSIPRVMAIPNFMVDTYSSRPQYGTIFALSMNDLTEAEFKFLANYSDWGEAPRESLDEILSKHDISDLSLGLLHDYAVQEYGQSTLSRKINSLDSYNLVSDRVNHNLRDILHLMDQKGVMSLGLKGWRNFMNGQEHFFQFYSGKTIRTFKDMYGKEINGKYIMFFDEFHKLAPQGQQSMVKDEFQDFYDVSGRQRDVATFISTQRPDQVPNPENKDDLDFISNLTDVFLMRGRTPLHEKQWKPIVANMGVYNKDGSKQLKKWQRKINSLEQYEGIYISSTDHFSPDDCPKIRTLSPLVAHPG